MKPARPLLAALLLALAGAPAFGDTPEQAEPPGTGVLCGWAFMAFAAEVGRQCFPGQDAEFQAELAGYVSRYDDYVARNGGATPDQIAAFKTRQGHFGDAKEVVCRRDSLEFYRAMRDMNPEERRAVVDEALARPGEPTWGTCT